MSTSHVWYVWFEANSHWYPHFCWGNLMKIPCPASSANNETLHAQFQELRQARKLFCGRGVLFFCDKGWWIELILHNSLFSDSHLFLPTYSAILGIAYSWEDFIMHVSFNHFLKCLLDFNICRKALSFTCCSLQFIQFFFTPLESSTGQHWNPLEFINSYGASSSRLASILPCVPGGDERSHQIAGVDEVRISLSLSDC